MFFRVISFFDNFVFKCEFCLDDLFLSKRWVCAVLGPDLPSPLLSRRGTHAHYTHFIFYVPEMLKKKKESKRSVQVEEEKTHSCTTAVAQGAKILSFRALLPSWWLLPLKMYFDKCKGKIILFYKTAYLYSVISAKLPNQQTLCEQAATVPYSFSTPPPLSCNRFPKFSNLFSVLLSF